MTLGEYLSELWQALFRAVFFVSADEDDLLSEPRPRRALVNHPQGIGVNPTPTPNGGETPKKAGKTKT